MNEMKVVECSGEVTILPNRKDPIVARLESVHGHPYFPPGKRVTTSEIVTISDDGTIETLNTIYKPIAK